MAVKLVLFAVGGYAGIEVYFRFERKGLENQHYTGYFETVAQSHSQYKDFCNDAGYKPLGRTNFAKRMEAIGFIKGKKENGIALEKQYPLKKS